MRRGISTGDAFVIPVAAALFDLVFIFNFFFINEKFIDAEIENKFVAARICAFRDAGIGSDQFGFTFAGAAIATGNLGKGFWLLGAAPLPIGPGGATATDTSANDIELIDRGAG